MKYAPYLSIRLSDRTVSIEFPRNTGLREVSNPPLVPSVDIKQSKQVILINTLGVISPLIGHEHLIVYTKNIIGKVG